MECPGDVPGEETPKVWDGHRPVPTTTIPDMTNDQNDRNKKIVDAFIQELFTAGDLGAIERYLAPGFVDHDPPVPDIPDGAEGLRRAAVMFRAALPDWHSVPDQMVAEGDVVVERFIARGTHRGELMGVAPTGKAIVLAGINVFRIDGDKIVERWGRLDELGLLRQLGLAP
jgi:predicted ester cyclase